MSVGRFWCASRFRQGGLEGAFSIHRFSASFAAVLGATQLANFPSTRLSPPSPKDLVRSEDCWAFEGVLLSVADVTKRMSLYRLFDGVSPVLSCL